MILAPRPPFRASRRPQGVGIKGSSRRIARRFPGFSARLPRQQLKGHPASPPVRGHREAELGGPPGGGRRRAISPVADHGPPVRPSTDPTPLGGAGAGSRINRLARAPGMPSHGAAGNVREGRKNRGGEVLRQLPGGQVREGRPGTKDTQSLPDVPALPVRSGRRIQGEGTPRIPIGQLAQPEGRQ